MEGFFLDFDNLEESLPPPVVKWGNSQITVANHWLQYGDAWWWESVAVSKSS